MTELPEVIIKRGKMLNTFWTARMKAVALLLLVLIYVFLVIFAKTMYAKTKRLDRIMLMAMKTERQMMEIHSLDQNIALNMQQIEDILQVY